MEEPGAQVLPHVGRHRKAIGGGGDLQNAVELVGGGESGDEQHAEPVDHRLDHHAANGDDGILQRYGRAQFQQGFGQLKTQAEILLVDFQQGDLFHIHKAVPRRRQLRDHRGDGRTGDPPAEAHDKQEIQPHV